MADPPAAESLPALLAACATESPDAEALVVGSIRQTYAELADAVERASRAFAALGVGRGDIVALLASNVPEWIPAALGAMKCGARIDAFNTWVKAHDLDHLLTASGASVLVIQDRVRNADLLGELRSLVPEVDGARPIGSARFPKLRRVVVIGDDIPHAAESWPDFLDSASDDPTVIEPVGRSGEPAFVLYTSGSTRAPKAVPLCHRDLIVNGFHIGERMGLGGDDRVWLGSPLFWSYGCANALMATMTHRACFLLQERFSARDAAELMARESVTAAYLLPTMIASLAGEVAEQIRGIRSLCTGVTIGSPETVERAAVELGISEICNVYGSTETYGNCCVTDHRLPLSRRLTSQGSALPGVDVRIVDARTGEELPAGEAGEAQVRGRVTSGYLGDENADADTFTVDGWFRTGDRLVRNSDGTFSFVDRVSDMIKTSGINVSPAEIENFLVAHPDVSEALVVGATHPSLDEVAVAFVVVRSPSVTPEELLRHCKARVAGYKVPQIVSIVADLPRTVTGKLVRRGLREQAAALVEAQLTQDRSYA
ncbi:class I adenylate-forming enzyme family protein [Rhodococcus jostii]|uniref:class I adenylate-forming enzyme family protein n=1 Tax=Rhodococcus jostii TaxID=132919 RepID=UPI00363FEFA1